MCQCKSNIKLQGQKYLPTNMDEKLSVLQIQRPLPLLQEWVLSLLPQMALTLLRRSITDFCVWLFPSEIVFFGFKVILGKGESSFYLYLEEAFHILQQIDSTIATVILFRHSGTQVNHCWFIEFSIRFPFSFPFHFKVPTKEGKQIKYLRNNSQAQCILVYYSILFWSRPKSLNSFNQFLSQNLSKKFIWGRTQFSLSNILSHSGASLPHNMQYTKQKDAWHYLKTVICAEFLQAIMIPGHF